MNTELQAYSRQMGTVEVHSDDQVPWGLTPATKQNRPFLSNKGEVRLYWTGTVSTASLSTVVVLYREVYLPVNATRDGRL